MFSSFIPTGLPRLPSFISGAKVIDLPSVKIHTIETATDKQSRRFKHLLKLNHFNHAVLFNDMKFHNHTPHLLGSAYLLNGTPEHLNDCYDAESSTLVPWEESPGEVSKDDWRIYLGNRDYQRAYLDFFEDQVVLRGYDWKAVVEEILFSGKEPLGNWLFSGLGHPIIHLGYGFEVTSREVAMEALTLAAVCYDEKHKYLDDPSYSKLPTDYITTSPIEALGRVSADKRFDGLFDHPGGDNMSQLFTQPDLEKPLLSHWNAWKLSDPKNQFRESQKLAVALLIASGQPESPTGGYDFFCVHLLTSSHAVRILLSSIPSNFHISVVRQWWLITIAIYISQLRPKLSYDYVTDYDIKDKDWDYVEKTALTGKHCTDAHYVKALRAMKEAEKTWGSDGGFYLKSAVKFATEFDGWGGFGAAGEGDGDHGGRGH